MNTKHFNPRAVGPRIRQARTDHGHKLDSFAARLGIPRSTVQAWESGNRPPNAEGLALMSVALDVTTDWLLFGD